MREKNNGKHIFYSFCLWTDSKEIKKSRMYGFRKVVKNLEGFLYSDGIITVSIWYSIGCGLLFHEIHDIEVT